MNLREVMVAANDGDVIYRRSKNIFVDKYYVDKDYRPWALGEVYIDRDFDFDGTPYYRVGEGEGRVEWTDFCDEYKFADDWERMPLKKYEDVVTGCLDCEARDEHSASHKGSA